MLNPTDAKSCRCRSFVEAREADALISRALVSFSWTAGAGCVVEMRQIVGAQGILELGWALQRDHQFEGSTYSQVRCTKPLKGGARMHRRVPIRPAAWCGWMSVVRRRLAVAGKSYPMLLP